MMHITCISHISVCGTDGCTGGGVRRLCSRTLGEEEGGPISPQINLRLSEIQTLNPQWGAWCGGGRLRLRPGAVSDYYFSEAPIFIAAIALSDYYFFGCGQLSVSLSLSLSLSLGQAHPSTSTSKHRGANVSVTLGTNSHNNHWKSLGKSTFWRAQRTDFRVLGTNFHQNR